MMDKADKEQCAAAPHATQGVRMLPYVKGYMGKGCAWSRKNFAYRLSRVSCKDTFDR